MKLGAGLLVLAFLLYFLLNIMGISIIGTRKDLVSDAKYYTDFYETGIKLTYSGSSPVNVRVCYEFYFDGEKMNQTVNYGMMKQGDWYTVGFHGYVTWCEVIYNGHKTRLTFTPKRTTVSESPP